MRTLDRLGLYLRRAARLRCPLCGVSPLFRPLGEVRGPNHWIHPIAGCSRCGYPYEREPGYFLLAIWGINYVPSAAFGIVLYLLLERFLDLSLPAVIAAVVIPVAFVSLLSIRHAKAIFLAIDHFLDP